MGLFKKGLTIGALLGAGLTWMSLTPNGRKTRDKMLDQAADIYVDIKKKAMKSDQWKKMSRNQYIKMVQESVDKYCVNNPTAKKAHSMLVKVLSAQWSRVKKEVSSKK
jgi:gas vesicle protein